MHGSISVGPSPDLLPSFVSALMTRKRNTRIRKAAWLAFGLIAFAAVSVSSHAVDEANVVPAVQLDVSATCSHASATSNEIIRCARPKGGIHTKELRPNHLQAMSRAV